MNKGKIVQIIGPVVDIEFPDRLPELFNALTVDYELPLIGKTRLTAQVNVYNLLDKEYFTGSTSWIPTANVGAPISAMGSLKLEY